MASYLEITNHIIDTNRINWTHFGQNSIYISFCDRDHLSIDFGNAEDAGAAYKILRERLINV